MICKSVFRWRVQERMEALAGARFNSCLLNLYRDGRDAMGWHSDNEPLYGAAPTIGACWVDSGE